MFYLLAAFCVGPIILYCYGDLLPNLVYFLLLSCILALLRARYLLLAACFSLGLFITIVEIISHQQSLQRFASLLGEQQVNVFLCSVPKSFPHYSQADFCAVEGEPVPFAKQKMRLTWANDVILDSLAEFYTLKVKLKPIRSSVNFVGSSYEQHLFHKRVAAQGKIIEILAQGPSPIELRAIDWFRQSLNVYRIKLDGVIGGPLEGLLHGGLIRALLTGERSKITPNDAEVLRYTGTQHLLAISGLHVGLVMFFLYRLMSSLPGRVPLTAVIGVGYVLMVGGSESAVRAWVMVLLALLWLSGRWRRDYLLVFFGALALVLAIDPLSTLNIGFWYSFLCVALLLLLSRFHSSTRVDGPSIFLVQVVLVFGMVPISALNGTVMGSSSFLANLFAVPWVSLVVLPLSFIALLSLLFSDSIAVFLFRIVDLSLQILIEFLVSLPAIFGEFLMGNSIWILLPFTFIVLSLIVFVRFSWLRYLFAGVLALVVFRVSVAADKSAEFVVFDAGQGLSAAMNWQGQYWLYDTGLSIGRYSLVESAVFPYFRTREALTNISGLVVSHGDADHAGGAHKTYQYLEPTITWSGEPGRVRGLQFEQACVEGMAWEMSGGSISVLYPFRGEQAALLSANNRSCVVLFSYGGYRFLLMGDVEGEAEMRIVERYKEALKADVLVAGHHGSGSASSYALLKHVRPQYVVASAGYLNRFGHPHSSVVSRVKHMNSELLSTSEEGALRFRIGEDELLVTHARRERAAFWLSKLESE